MPAKEIKELRQSGNLEEALALAKSEMEADPDNLWAKRNISWVYYDLLKQSTSADQFEQFINWLNEISNLQLPAEEKMLFEQLSWQIAKMGFALSKDDSLDVTKGIRLFQAIQPFHFTKPAEGYSILFKALHKILKETEHYISFADWWGFQYFLPVDYQKDKLPNGREVMAIAEQAYIAYAKHLLPKQLLNGDVSFDRQKVEAFLPSLLQIVDNYPHFQYPAYFHAKLLLAIGDKENILESLLPFAKKKRHDFWVWEILSEAFTKEPDKVFACYCMALSLKSPEKMLINLRQKMAKLLIDKKYYNEAKTEIELLLRTRSAEKYKIPVEVSNWQTESWYASAISSQSNLSFYKPYLPLAESVLYYDVPEELVIVEFVNSDKKVLNFIASDTKFGFFKYDRFFQSVKIGDVLKVRFQGGTNQGIHQVYTAEKTVDDVFRNRFVKQISGVVKIQNGKAFGFLDGIFIHPSLVSRYKLTDGSPFTGTAVKTYNQDKKMWSWKVI